MWVQASHSILDSTPETRCRPHLSTESSGTPRRAGGQAGWQTQAALGCVPSGGPTHTHPGLPPSPPTESPAALGLGPCRQHLRSLAVGVHLSARMRRRLAAQSPLPPSMVSRACTATRSPPCQATGKSLILFVARKSTFPRDGAPSGTAFYCRPVSLT